MLELEKGWGKMVQSAAANQRGGRIAPSIATAGAGLHEESIVERALCSNEEAINFWLQEVQGVRSQ